ncbi:MAG: sugar ABC transporter permease [Paenibacillaceae bacterium]|nr:sugar ABC transporter permease [Paenibacillaceae bacterium]
MKLPFRLNQRRRHILEGYVFVLPFVCGILLFFAFPLYISFKLSFGKLIRMVGFHIEWTGFANYTRAFLIDVQFVPKFLDVVYQTMYKAPLIVIFSLLLAIVINKNIKFRGFFRTVFFIPFLLGKGDVMRQLLNLDVDKMLISVSDGSLIPRELLTYLGSGVVSVLDALFGIIILVLWSSGVQILLFLSGLQNIPASLYESSKMDGANEWEMFWKITFPLISPILLLVIIYTFVDSFTDVTNAILLYIKDLAFKSMDFAYAAALGWIYFAFIIVLVLAVMFVINTYIRGLEAEKGGGKHAR